MGSSLSPSRNAAAAGHATARRSDNLALAFQEILTVIVRLRSNRQYIENAEAFRARVKALLKQAAKDAAAAGYAMDDVRDATFAVVAFLDESVLSSANPISEDWKRKPLQEELFTIHMGGEFFFHSLEKLLMRKDSSQTADLLEVYSLCLQLGYRGRYGGGGSEEWRGYRNRVAAKIREIRGGPGPLSEGWAPAGGSAVLGRPDPWTRRLIWIAGAYLLLVLILFAAFKISLSSGVSDLTRMV